MNIILRKISRFIRPIAYLIGYLKPVDKNKIVVSNFSGKGYGDNPKYIVEALLKRKADIRIIWILRNIEDKESLPKGVEYCLEKSFMSSYHLRTAKFWIDNCRKSFRYKRKNQFYLQTWHGFALKRIENDVQSNLSNGYVKEAIRDSKHIDLIVSCSSFMSKIYKKSFWYDGKVVELGAPRNDILIKNDIAVSQKVRDYFRISDKTRIVLYAPTFRADKMVDSYTIDYESLKIACQERFKKDFIIFVRLHPSISNADLGIEFDGCNILNVSLYQDMQELLCAVDIVVTDYSSLMFDFALTKKPCFLFATDIDSYKQDRNFYFEVSELPFSMAKSNEELRNNIIYFNNDIYVEKLETFFEKTGMVLSGNASEKCAGIVLDVLKKTNNS